MNKLPYPTVTIAKPFLNVYSSGTLSEIVTVGPTLLYISRVGEDIEFASYAPLEQVGNRFLFAFDAQLFSKSGGRYTARFVYNGTEINTFQFTFDKVELAVVGSDDV